MTDSPNLTGTEPACPEEWWWMKPGTWAWVTGREEPYVIDGKPAIVRGKWEVQVINGVTEGKSHIKGSMRCADLAPHPAPPSEADSLRSQLEAAQQKIQRLDALLVKAAGYIDLTPDTPGYETRLELMERIRNEWHSK